jgi:hypothetical protein
MHLVNLSGKPDAGNPPVRFDEGDQGHLVPTLLLMPFHLNLARISSREPRSSYTAVERESQRLLRLLFSRAVVKNTAY